jgi:hypothetical protein
MKMKRTVVFIVSILFLIASRGFSQTTVSGVYITGNFTVGSTLNGFYTTSGGGSNIISQVWYRVSPRTSVATGSDNYTIQAADLGKGLYLKVLVIKSGTGDTLSRDSSAVSVNIAANAKPVASGVKILGTLHSGMTVFGTYNYSDLENDAEGTSTFKWEVADDASGTNPQTVSTASSSYTITDADTNKHLRFSVTPVASGGTVTGTEVSSTWSSSAIINDIPVATVPTVTYTSLNVNSALTAHYTYSDTEGNIESGSKYQWYSSTTLAGTYDPIANDTLSSHIILMAEQGRYFKFSVTPRSSAGSSPGVLKRSIAYGPANSKPYTDNLTVFGTTTIGSTLKARYKYHDINSDAEGVSKFQWYREAIAITGATDSAYVLTAEDVDFHVKFEVTPVSSTGFPDTGSPVMSSLSAKITDPAPTLPSAKDLCIQGTRADAQELTGRYTYIKNGSHDEGLSIYLWKVGNTFVKSGTGTTNKKYTLTSSDIGKEIIFAVIPKNNKSTPQIGDTVFSNPMAIFTMPRESFTIADPPITLSATPGGGVFSGDEGVSGNTFTPADVNIANSPFNMLYQLTINLGDNTCVQSASTKLSVSGITMAFQSFKDRYCQNNGLDTIWVRNMPKGYIGTFYMSDMNGYYMKLNDTTLVINPDAMKVGNKDDIVIFAADSAFGKHIEISRPFIIDAVPVLSILNLPNDTVLCNNAVPFKLFVSHDPGIFTGPVTGGTLDPSLTVGNAVVKYTHITVNGCVASVSVPIKINPAPKVSFAAKDYCIESSTDITKFINKSTPNKTSPPLTPSDSVNKWLWAFYDAGGIDTSSLREPGYLYKTGGFHKIILTATTLNNCTSVKDSTIDLGVKPLADFYWLRECFHPADSIFLKDTTFSSSVIASRTWIFPGKDTINLGVLDKSLKYPKLAPGYLDVKYIVRTNYLGCHDTVSKSIYIRPTISLSTDDYFENFEAGNGGWVKDYEKHNTWSFGTPSRTYINKAASGVNAWVTNFATDTIESSSVISPCFDFSTIQRPMIKVKLWKRFEINRDGGALQYKIGDDPSGWQYVGTFDDGIVWYNSTLIKGRPGGDQIGWTAGAGNQKDADWVESRHKLDELMGKKDVKFRIAYGSDGTARDNDGLAVDDIWIGRRTRGVLLEHYTNNMSSDANTASDQVTELSNRDTVDIINIQYHTNFPGSGDTYYNDNPGDASARVLYYGLSRTPYSFIDGGTRKNYANIFDYRPTPLDSPLDSNDLKRRSLISPYFLITLITTESGGVLTISGQIKALETITNSENVTLYLAVTERKNVLPVAEGGRTEFYNVFRKFIPDAGGISLKKSWTKNEIYTIAERTWVIEKIPNNSDIEVIAFIQNNITKEIYQAESNRKHNVTVGVDNLFVNEGKGFSLYPNPASDRLTIAFEQSLLSETDIMIYDFKGTVVRSYKAGSGQEEFTISGLGLKQGIYLVRIKSGLMELGFKKLIVSDY